MDNKPNPDPLTEFVKVRRLIKLGLTRTFGFAWKYGDELDS